MSRVDGGIHGAGTREARYWITRMAVFKEEQMREPPIVLLRCNTISTTSTVARRRTQQQVAKGGWQLGREEHHASPIVFVTYLDIHPLSGLQRPTAPFAFRSNLQCEPVRQCMKTAKTRDECHWSHRNLQCEPIRQ